MNLFKVHETGPERWWVDLDSQLIGKWAWYEHVFWSLNYRITWLQSLNWSRFKVIIWHEKIDWDTPIYLSRSLLMSWTLRVTGNPDSVVRYGDAVLLCLWALTPLKIKYVICNINPFSADVLRVVKFFKNSAWLVDELSTGSPWCCYRPIALSWMEQEFLHFFASI